jgi:hypothetical protein
MNVNYNISELIFGYLDKNDKLKLINLNLFNRDLCFDQLIILYGQVNKKNNMLKTIQTDCYLIHMDNTINENKILNWSHILCNICNTYTPNDLLQLCLKEEHLICNRCILHYNNWFDICSVCKISMIDNVCILCIFDNCDVCNVDI